MAVVVGGAILGAIGEGAAATATILTIGSTAITVGAVVGEIALVAGSIGLSYVAQALSSKAANTNTGSSGKLQSGGIVPRTFLAGYGMTAGKLAYVNTWGKDGKTPNAYLSMVISLSDLPIDSLQGLIVNDTPATYGSGVPDANLGYAIPEFSVSGTPYLWVKFYDGTQTLVDTHLFTTFGSDPNFPYESSRVGHGVSYAVVTARLNQNLFSGFPTFKFIVNGIKLYDPRKDNSVGGDGAHRFDDQSTWEFSQNPKVIEYNILRGVTYGGAWFYGLQSLAASRLPLSSWIASMNECDMEVDNNEGGTEPQYRCGGEIAVNVAPTDAIGELNKCCNGRLAEIGGVYKTHCGAAGSPVFTITDGDLLTTDQQTFNQFPGLSDLINAVTASYPDPYQGWELSPAPGRYSDDLEADDGGRQLVSDVQYNMVPYAEQVQRLMQSALDEARRFRKHTIPLPPGAWALEPLDFMSWSSARNGYDSKTFRIDLATDMASLEMVLVITEVDPSDYDWDPETDFIPTSSGPLVVAHPATQSMVGFAVEPATIEGDDGRSRPGVAVSWGTDDIDDVDGVIIEIRLASTSAVVWSGETPHSAEQFLLGTFIPPANLVADTDYEVRARYRPISYRDTSWSSWLPVTTYDIRFGAADLYDEAITRAKLDDALKSFNDFVGSQVQDVLDEVQKVSQAASEIGLGTASDVQAVRQSLTSSQNGFAATFTSLIETATGPDSAVVTQQATLTAALGGYLGAGAVSNAFTSTTAAVTTVANTIGGSYDPSSTVAAAITSANSNITSLTNALTGYTGSGAVASAVSSLSTSITYTQNTIGGSYSPSGTVAAALSSNSASITSLNSALAGYMSSGAVATAISTLNTSVTATQNTIGGSYNPSSTVAAAITSNASAITQLTTNVGTYSASGLFRASVTSTLAGADATIAIAAAASSGGSAYTAGLYINAKSDGTTELLAVANRFAITDGTNKATPFLFSGGTLYVDNAVIKNLTVSNLSIGAATNTDSSTGGSATISDGNWHTVATASLTTIGGRVLLIAQAQFNTSKTGSPFADYGSWQLLMDGSLISDGSNYAIGKYAIPTQDVIGLNYAPNTFMFAFTPSAGSHTFELQCNRQNSTTISVIAGFMHAFESRR